jgi:hypothetical protein
MKPIDAVDVALSLLMSMGVAWLFSPAGEVEFDAFLVSLVGYWCAQALFGMAKLIWRA